MKKLMALLVAVLFAGVANAQVPEKGLSWDVEASLGSQIEVAARAKYNFNQYVAWDIATLKYGHEWDKEGGEWSLKTGVRGFAPEIWGGIRPFAALDLGYVGMHGGGYTSWFGLDFTIGAYVWKNLYIGYGLDSYHKSGFNFQDHFARIGWSF